MNIITRFFFVVLFIIIDQHYGTSGAPRACQWYKETCFEIRIYLIVPLDHPNGVLC